MLKPRSSPRLVSAPLPSLRCASATPPLIIWGYHSMTVATVPGATTLAARRFGSEVIWDGEPKAAIVLEADGSPLLGMAMLRGFRVTLDVLVDGQLTIERLA